MLKHGRLLFWWRVDPITSKSAAHLILLLLLLLPHHVVIMIQTLQLNSFVLLGTHRQLFIVNLTVVNHWTSKTILVLLHLMRWRRCLDLRESGLTTHGLDGCLVVVVIISFLHFLLHFDLLLSLCNGI